MKATPSVSLALVALCSLALAGCRATTTVKLTGTPGAQLRGHYRASHVNSDFSGAADWEMGLGSSQRLEEFEFRKKSLDHSVDLDIWQGNKRLVHATANPGTAGLRVRREDGWRVETLR